MTPSEERLERFKVVEREADSEGRVLGFRRIRPSERTRLDEWFPDLKERGAVFICASCCEIDEVRIPFARSRGELEAIMDRLDDPGILAGTVAIQRIYGIAGDESSEGGDMESAAKK